MAKRGAKRGTRVESLEDMLSQAQAAKILGVSRQAVNERVRAGKIPTVSFGGREFIMRKHVQPPERSTSKRKT